MKNAKVVEICNFIDGIRRVYSFSNLNDFFKMDIPNIKSILEAIDINELSKEKKTRKIAVEKLKIKLQEYLELIAKELLDELKKLVESAEQEEEKNTIEVNQEQGDTSSESIKQWYDFNKIKREICCDKYIAEKVKFIYDKDDYYCIPGLAM